MSQGALPGYGYVPDNLPGGTSGPSSRAALAPGAAPWPTLPVRALWYAAGGIVGGFVLASTVAVVCIGLGLSLYSPVTVILDLCALWLFLSWAAIRASRRYGTGSLGHDYRFGFQPFDAARGAWASIIGRLAVTVVTGLILAAAGHSVSGNTQVLKQQQGHPWHVLLVGAGAVIGAPIFEELFFRGLVLRSLASRLPYGRAVLIQGVLFGLAHAQGGQDGWSTFAIVAGTATFGVVQLSLIHI